jgi:hypothetical protein
MCVIRWWVVLMEGKMVAIGRRGEFRGKINLKCF